MSKADSARFVDEVYGYGGGGGGGGALTQPQPTHSESLQSSPEVAPSFGASLVKKGVVWVVCASLLGIGLAATIILLRFRSIDANEQKLELDEQNSLKQKTVLIGIVSGIGLAGALLLVTRLTLKWHF